MIEGLAILFSIGLLGSLHCIGMCGGLIGALAMGRSRVWWSGLLVYQLGRVTTYAMFGTLVGVVGLSLGELGGTFAQKLLTLFAGLFMIVFGFNLAGWLPDPLTHLSVSISRRLGLGRLAASLATDARLLGWYGMGMVNGLLPCGLVYAALALALAAGNVLESGLMMVSFGIGTIPAMLLAPALLRRLAPELRGRAMQVAAVMLIVLGALTMLRGSHGGHEGDGQVITPALSHMHMH